MISRLRIGQRAEKQAERHLRQHGLRTLLRNWRCRSGEIDLVCEEQDMLVVVEVRARSREDYGHAVDTVDQRKQAKLIRTAQAMLQAHPQWQERPLRFDVVGISQGRIDWVRDAFEA